MSEYQLVVLLGDSLLMDTVEASLRKKRALGMVRIQGDIDSWQACIEVLCPDLVIFDWGTPGAQIALSLLRNQPGIPLIGIDITTNNVTVLSSCQCTPLAANDLTEVIQLQTFIGQKIKRRSSVLGNWSLDILQ
jgi:hypothetical protein